MEKLDKLEFDGTSEESRKDLESKFNKLVGKKIASISVDKSGEVKIETEDGSSLKFNVPRDLYTEEPVFDESDINLK